jgi:hypothetical protein
MAMNAARAERLARVAAAHAAFVRMFLPLADFDPAGAAERPGYNLWYLDLDPPRGAEDMYQRAVRGEPG